MTTIFCDGAPGRTATTSSPDSKIDPVSASIAPSSAGSSATDLVHLGQSQYSAGEYTAAAQSFSRALELDPQNSEAKDGLVRLARESVDRNQNRTQSSADMLNDVERAWQAPRAVAVAPGESRPSARLSPLEAKLDAIVLPTVNFSGLELGRVVTSLSAASEEFDLTGTPSKGVNIVLVESTGANLPINISLHDLSLRRVLDLITESAGCHYEVQADAVVIRPEGGPPVLETRFFPVSRSTVLRMTGRGAAEGAGKKADPLAGNGREPASPAAGEGSVIRNFLQLAGVGFDSVPGSTLAFDGSQLIVTQTSRNLERIRNIMNRYSSVRQVEIEAKFMEVQDGALEELGVNWTVSNVSRQTNPAAQSLYQTANRALADAFNNLGNSKQGRIVGGDGVDQTIANSPPVIPGTNNLGVNTLPLAVINGSVGEFNINAVVRALAQRSGTELLSAPKLTVLSGNPATITVAQELRYPQSYGQVQSQVGTGSASGGGSAGVAITAGTPQDFITRNIGVELKVTPTVEEDDHSISLDLNPRVTEFEGFVEYGGQSIAIAGNPSTTVTVPSGFYQPIFGVRELTTKVTIWDGATLMMGGLTRQDVQKNNDKVPVIGNIPVLGRLFRSKGESTQKRNLLIFVTARLVNPGGTLVTSVAAAKPAQVSATGGNSGVKQQ
jgi:general secretion pathway protein D